MRTARRPCRHQGTVALTSPPSLSAVSCPVSVSMPAWRASTCPDLDGSVTKQTVSGPMNTHSHHFAGPLPSRGAKTRQLALLVWSVK
jgi:hypothetical protein